MIYEVLEREKKSYIFVVYLKFQFSNLQGEKLETKLKCDVVLTAISQTFAYYFTNIEGYKSPNEVIFVALES